MIIPLPHLPHISEPTSWAKALLCDIGPRQRQSQRNKESCDNKSHFFFSFFPRTLACTKGQRNIPIFVKCLSDSPGVCSPSGTFWMCWTMTPPKYWPNSMPRPWLGGKEMNTLFDNCHHWKSACVIVSWNKRACKSHLVMQALSYQLLGAAFKSLLRKMVFSTPQPRLPW